MYDTFARMRYGLRRSLRTTSGKLFVLALIALSVPVGVTLVQSTLTYRTQAVDEPVLLYLSPAAQMLPPNSTFQFMADSKTNQIGFVRVKFSFDPTQVQLNSEIIPSSVFKTVVEKTTMADANIAGSAVIVVALSTADVANPPTGIFQVASASFTPVSATTNQTTSITIDSAESQVVSMASNILPVAKIDAALTLNVSNLTATLSPTFLLSPTTSVLTPTTTLSPTPIVQTTNVLEAENMNFSTTALSVLSDSIASNGKVLRYYSNGSATGNIITPNSTTQLVVTAKGESCKGNARVEVSVDGVIVMKNKSVSGSAYTNYTVTLNKSAGSHSISATFTNDYASSTCDRNLRVDKITLQ